jgi:hypothetical protein
MRILGGILFLWGCCAQLSVCHFGSRLTKNTILALQKWKMHFSLNEMKIGLRGVPRYHKGHAGVQYGLVPTNYAMIMTKSSSFYLKATQPRTW